MVLYQTLVASIGECEMILCMAVRHIFRMAEKGSPGCAASVGCTLLQAEMSHSKGGSESVCVNYDTSTALALASLDIILHRCTEALIWKFMQCYIRLSSVCLA